MAATAYGALRAFHSLTRTSLTGKQTDFARYELVFTPVRRPRRGHLDCCGKPVPWRDSALSEPLWKGTTRSPASSWRSPPRVAGSAAETAAVDSGHALWPPVSFTRRPDGRHLAYQVVGEGHLDLVYLFGWSSHLGLAWDNPSVAEYLGKLSLFPG